MEYYVENVTAYETSKPDSLVVVIPKTVRRMLKLERGAKFQVKVDSQGRIVYEPIKEVMEKGAKP
jgi:antitoxin component of MazEF toxin-antitoxin module